MTLPHAETAFLAPNHIVVMIPARNEEELLPFCLSSVQTARTLLPPWCTSDVVVVADRCEDRTEALAQHALGAAGVVVASGTGMVGAARSLAATVALQRYKGAKKQCWLASTDADCRVPPDWLLHHLRAAGRGVHALAGIVHVEDFSEHLPHVCQRFQETYLVADDGTHDHVHGANLGLRADTYLHVGGWAPLATAEDHDLWRRLRASGAACESDASLKVLTSGRKTGRAPLGFADALAAHNEYVL